MKEVFLAQKRWVRFSSQKTKILELLGNYTTCFPQFEWLHIVFQQDGLHSHCYAGVIEDTVSVKVAGWRSAGFLTPTLTGSHSI
jgi:hypothetical protein